MGIVEPSDPADQQIAVQPTRARITLLLFSLPLRDLAGSGRRIAFLVALAMPALGGPVTPAMEELIRTERFEALFVHVAATRAGWAAEPGLSPGERALRLHRLGTALYDDDRIPLSALDPALDMIAAAGELLLTAAEIDTLATVEALEDGSTVFFQRRDTEMALRLSERRIELLDAAHGASHRRRELARVDHAKVLYADGQFDQAVEFLEPRLPTLRRELANDSAALADALTVLAQSYRGMGRLQRNVELQLEAFALLESQMTEDGTAREELRGQWLAQTHNLATAYVDLGQYHNAELRYREIERYCEMRSCEPRTEILYRKGLALVARRQQRLDAAQERLETLLEDMLAMDDLPPGEFGLVYDELGWVQREREDWVAAEASFQTALDSLQREPRRRRQTIPLVMRRVAEVQAAQGKNAQARASFEAALSASEALHGPDVPPMGIVLTSYAEWLVAEDHRWRDPASMLDRALDLLGDDPLLIGYRIDAQATRARLYWREGESAAAIGLLERALRDAEYLRAVAAFDPADRARVFSTRLDDALELLYWHVQLGHEEAAWRVYERTRARSMLDDLQSARGLTPYAERTTPESPEVTDARERVSAARTALQGASASDLEAALHDFDTAYRRLLLARARMTRETPESHVSLGEQAVVDLSTVRESLLAEGEVLLAYALGKERTLLLIVRHDRPGLDARELPRPPGWNPTDAFGSPDADRLSLLDRLRSYEQAFDRATAEELEALTDHLLPSDLRGELAEASSILVLPDGPLHRFPVSAFVLEAGDDASETVFWLDRMPPVRFAPSATVLFNLSRRTRSRSDEDQLLVISDPTFDSTRLNGSLAALPHSRREAKLLQDLDASTIVMAGARATEAAFRDSSPSASILHLATHGVVETRARHDVASLILTPGPPGAPRSNDGFLDLDEIVALDLEAELSVISACSSNFGRTVRGEGVFALARAFLIAGSARVIGTLWPVQDYATAWSMERFYTRLLDDATPPASPAEALYEVQRDIRREQGWESPAHWASFVCTGLR